MKGSGATEEVISDRLIRTVCDRLAANKRVRRTLPLWGRVHIDRQLPFLCVYRRPIVGDNDKFVRLVNSEASYLCAPAVSDVFDGLSSLVRGITSTLSNVFGAFLVLELWPAPLDAQESRPPGETPPGFRIFASKDEALDLFCDEFEQGLRRITINKLPATVDVVRQERIAPYDFPPIISRADARALHCSVIGLEINQVYHDPRGGRIYPLLLRDLEQQLTGALRQMFYGFARKRTTQRPRHYHGLGRRAVVKAVWEVDRRLAEVSSSFDFLLQVTPYNVNQAWKRFRQRNFQKPPVFRYRPLPVDPLVLKRKLFAIPVARLEDPALRNLFREKQDELDRRLTMLLDVNSSRFVHGSAQVYGEVDPPLLRLARQILRKLPAKSGRGGKARRVGATAFVRRAEGELDYYRARWPEMKSGVQIRNDITGLMVSRGRLLVNRDFRVPSSRVNALLHHEIGTHIVTYVNGRAQPFRQLYTGLAGYEALQEGLAVFAEYLVGGLTRTRMRTLAARVVGVSWMLDDATFIEAFSRLESDFAFDHRTAFNIALRVYRGGGLTKDAIYLKGLADLLAYFQGGGSIEPLLIGKMAAEHVSVIEELRWRKVLSPPPLRPRFLTVPGAAARLERARGGLALLDLVNGDDA